MTELVRVVITNDIFALRQLCKKKDDGSRCFSFSSYVVKV